MSFKRLSEESISDFKKTGTSPNSIMIINYVKDCHTEIDRLIEQAQEHGSDFYKWRENWESHQRVNEKNVQELAIQFTEMYGWAEEGSTEAANRILEVTNQLKDAVEKLKEDKKIPNENN